MTEKKFAAVEVDDREVQRPWDDGDLVTDWSAFPQGYGILLNERLMFPEDLCLWRMKIDKTRQLFVDDFLVAHRRGLTRQFHRPQDHPANPLMPNCWAHYLCRDDKGFRLYYDAYGPGGVRVAFSSDGLHWDKSDLNLCERPAEDTPDEPNNLIGIRGLFGLFHEPDDPEPSQRWKAISGPATKVIWPYAHVPAKSRPAWRGGGQRLHRPDAPSRCTQVFTTCTSLPTE